MIREVHPEGLRLIRHHEGFSLEAYRCPAGFWTNDTGNLITRDRSAPQPPLISTKEAEELFLRNVSVAARSVLNLILVPLTDGQYAALVSFTFNLGGGKLKASTLRRKVNAGDHGGAAEEFGKWVFSGGVKLRGLVIRREDERRMYVNGL